MKKAKKAAAVFLFLILSAFLAAYVFGVRAYIIRSDSMAPKYPKGSLAFLDSRVPADDIRVDDVIGIRDGNLAVFHRVAEIREGGEAGDRTAILYGDAKGKAHSSELPLSNSTLLGRELFTLPGIGSAAALLSGKGLYVLLIGAVLLAAAAFPWEKLSPRSKGAKKDGNKAPSSGR